MLESRSCDLLQPRSAWPCCRSFLFVALLGPILPGNCWAATGQRLTPVVRAVRDCSTAVVNIQGKKSIMSGGETGVATARQVNGMGTGVLIDPRGYILTNHHVVDGVRRINVTLASGQSYIASTIAHDRETDLAIIRIRTPHRQPIIRIGTSRDLMTGESVLAVGNAFGYEHTVTTGVISALHRNVQVNETQQYLDLIQTDASINPGNSGGPLLNIDGEMIGVNVAVRAGAQGIGFAIPVDKALDIATKLISIEKLDRNWHGITPLVAEEHEGQVSVLKVDRDSPAAESGLRRGDHLEKIGSVSINRPLDVERALLGRRSGDRVPLTVLRQGETVELDLRLASLPRAGGHVAQKRAISRDTLPTPTEQFTSSFNQQSWSKLGMELQPASRATLRNRGMDFRGGMRVIRVREGSSAEDEGVVAGDILVRVHRWYTTNEQDVRYVLNRANTLSRVGSVRFDIVRGEDRFFGHLAVKSSGSKTQR